jgi:DNA-binding transcriptional LysR family regulator
VDLREFEAFLTLAEELHFGRTAQRLHLSSARVSQLIQALERRIGAPVVRRTSRSVQLTPIGERLRSTVGPAYEQFHRSIADAQRTARHQGEVLRLGLWHTITRTLAGALCDAFQARHPAYQVQILTQVPADLYEPLRRGRVDVLLFRVPAAPADLPDEPDIVLGPALTVEPRTVTMAHDHPLADRERVDVEELADYELVRMSDTFPSYFQDLWTPPVTPAGRPILRPSASPAAQIDEVWDLVARGHLLHVTIAEVLQMFPRRDLVTVPLTGLPPMHTVLAWRTNPSDLVRAFVEM